MSAADPLVAVRNAIVRGLSFDEPLVVATGLRPVAEVDPTTPTRDEVAAQTKSSDNKVAGAMLRINDRWNAMTERERADDTHRRTLLERARVSVTGDAASLAVRMVRCWVDVPHEASFLYVSDRRWLVTMTVAAAREWRAMPTQPQAAPSAGLVRDLGSAARQLGKSLIGDGELTKGLSDRADNGASALVVVWSVPRNEVTAQANATGVQLGFSDGSGLVLGPGRPEWPLAQRVEALSAAAVPVTTV